MTSREVDEAIRSTVELVALIVERAGREPDPLAFVRARVEQLQLELVYLAPSSDGGGGGGGG